MAKKKTKSRAAKSMSAAPRTSYRQDTTWAFIGTIPILGYILAMISKRSDDYVMYYARQGLALGIIYLAVNLVLTLLIVTIPLMMVWNLVSLVLWIISVRNALSSMRRSTPFVGWLADKF